MNGKININEPNQGKSADSIAFLSAGFRPFFLFAGLYAVLPVFAWVAAFLGDGNTPGEFAPSYWHGHEMVFGFVSAAATGFLLTAVPNWTRTLPFSGKPLTVLVLIWFCGRLAMWFGWPAGPFFVAIVDLTLIPALGIYIGRRLVAHRVRRNYIVLVVLSILFLANLMMHLENMGMLTDSAGLGLNLGIYAVVFLVAMISGRVIPGFTANALHRRGIDADTQTPTKVAFVVISSLILAAAFDLFGGDSEIAHSLAGGMAGLVSLALLVRMWRWKTRMILGDPIVWVLHVGHFWLVIGFALLAGAHFNDGMMRDAGLHALTTGAIGTMIIGMMTRAGLGHSGREIKASGAITAAYLMIITGAALRTVAAVAQAELPGDGYSILIGVAGLLWAGGFVVFVSVFWPILTRPKI
jgi:uncharacterized protein involved in response to NO